jgi:cysteine-rich repeat protein
LGFGPGPLGCKAGCEFEVTRCSPGELCGNGELDGAEQCDDGDDNSDTDPDVCRVNCAVPSCGDSVVDGGEGCDDGSDNSDFRADACRSDCRPARCGDGLIDSGEDCDSDKLGRGTCAREGFTAGVVACSDECTFDTSGCVTCGDGVADGQDEDDPTYEECDTDDFRGSDCTDFGFAGGRLSCSECEIETTLCGDVESGCGNHTVETGEVCDGTDLDGSTCADFDFTGGQLGCENDCQDFDLGRCNTCGNGVIDGGEVCDDGNSANDFTCSADCRAECGIGYGECNGDTSEYCGFDRSGNAAILTEYCDPLQGLSCVDGLCQGPCAVG